MDKEALVLEKDAEIADSLCAMLRERSYSPTWITTKKDFLRFLKERRFSLTFIGHHDQETSPFGAMKDTVVTSPMTSIILITDLPEEEIHREAEGYGILGHISRHEPEKEIARLIDTFERIFESMQAS